MVTTLILEVKRSHEFDLKQVFLLRVKRDELRLAEVDLNQELFSLKAHDMEIIDLHQL